MRRILRFSDNGEIDYYWEGKFPTDEWLLTVICPHMRAPSMILFPPAVSSAQYVSLDTPEAQQQVNCDQGCPYLRISINRQVVCEFAANRTSTVIGTLEKE
jgi:hypothetical protein